MICEFYLTVQLFLKSKKKITPPTPSQSSPGDYCSEQSTATVSKSFQAHQMHEKVTNGLRNEIFIAKVTSCTEDDTNVYFAGQIHGLNLPG